MKTLNQILAATALALPLATFAQTPTTAPRGVTPSDQPTSTIERDAQTKTGEATKHGTQPSDASTGTTGTSKMPKGGKHDTMKQKGRTEAGDAPTYPAPAKDGTPTK